MFAEFQTLILHKIKLTLYYCLDFTIRVFVWLSTLCDEQFLLFFAWDGFNIIVSLALMYVWIQQMVLKDSIESLRVTTYPITQKGLWQAWLPH